MDKVDMCLSLFKIFTNYLEVYKLNTDIKKENKQQITRSKNQNLIDPLSSIHCETNENSLSIIPSTSSNANIKQNTESAKQFKGLKRKYLEESPEKRGRKKLNKNDDTQAILETDDGIGVTQDELVKRNVIKKKEIKSKKVIRRWWVREEYTQRDKSGYFVSTYLKMKKENNSEFFELTRTELPIYELLLDLLREDLTKRSIRAPIDYECRLAVTLTYLSQSTPFFQLATTFQIGKSTIREMILDTCDVIWKILSPEYTRRLNENDYKNIANDFLQKFGIPNCIGAFDSKILNIMMPSRRSPKYKETNLKYMSLDITCDTNYLITWADIHPYSEEENLEILDTEFTDMPPEKPLPDSNLLFPHYFIGDTSFPLKEHIMRPYANRNLDDPKKIVFNHYMSTAHNIIENTYGILASRWTILQTEFKCYPENLKKIVLAIIALHNFIIKNSDIEGIQNKYCPNGFVDWIDEFGNKHEGEWRKYVKKLRRNNQGKYGSNNASRNALLLRDNLADYFYANENSFQIVNA